MTLIAIYPTKKNLKDNIGKPLRYQETSLVGRDYDANGELVVCNRPHITGIGREWFATVKLEDGIIKSVR